MFDVPRVPLGQGPTERGKVVAVHLLGTQTTPRGDVHGERIEVQIDGEVVTVERSRLESEADYLPINAGDEVLLSATEGPNGVTYFIVDYVRDQGIWLLALVFIAIVLLVARGHGAWSLVGLVASFVVILRFIIPGILAGYNPPLIAFIGGSVIMATTLYLAHGVNTKTSVALAGTALALLITIVLGNLSIELLRLSGFVTEEATTLHLLSEGGIDARGLLLAGIIIGALGVLDDVTVAQAASVFEIRRANFSLTAAELFARGMNIGRDHIASTVNTLFLAYSGASLPLLLILSTQAESLASTMSQELVATEIVRTLVGGIGITTAVPVTTALAALFAHRLREPDEPAPVTTEPVVAAPVVERRSLLDRRDEVSRK